MPQNETNTNKVVFITGAAKRIGAGIARFLHAQGWQVIIHYNTSENAANKLCAELNQQRADSTITLQADLNIIENYSPLIEAAASHWQRLDAVINNASIFFPTPASEANIEQWNHLFTTNVVAPFFLTQAAFPYLQLQKGSVINITDTHADGRPIKNHVIYNMTKSALLMQTQSLARDLAPSIRVNAVAPGISEWNKAEFSIEQENILERTPLKRAGNALEIAKAVGYLLNDATYTTGSVIYVDGGRCVFN